MTCLIAHTARETIIQLPPELAEDDLETIESGFERAVDRGTPVVIVDCSETHHVSAQLVALLGLLRLQARRAGMTVELRHLREELGGRLRTPLSS